MNSRFRFELKANKASLNHISGLSFEEEIKSIKITIRHSRVPYNTNDTVVLQRSLEDPTALVIHRKGEGVNPLFSRKDIVVNEGKCEEETIASTSPSHDSNELTCKRISHSEENSISVMKKTNDTNKDGNLEKRYGDRIRKKSITSDYYTDCGRRSKENSPMLDGSQRKLTKYCESPDKKYYKTPSYSRSPTRSDRSRSMAHNKNKYVKSPRRSKYRSRSPNFRRKYKIDTERSTRRSKTPSDVKKKYTDKCRPCCNKRSPSPYTRNRSRSPYKSRKRSITPPRRNYERLQKDRSKSPPGHRLNSDENNSSELSIYDGMQPEFNFYVADPYWIPGPAFMPRGMVPPPRSFFRPPYFHPTPKMSFPHPYLYCRPRFSNQHNRPVGSKLSHTTGNSTTVGIQTTSNKPVINVVANKVNCDAPNRK
ncbi:hypothetical protein FQR65_LT11076 [Abscondita terminalis]|nr:hypothetical protein FQR65_LT11076 [Abscondita terminalis]